MFSTGQESTPQGRRGKWCLVASGFGRPVALGGTSPKQDAASALKGMQAETRVPRASGAAS